MNEWHLTALSTSQVILGHPTDEAKWMMKWWNIPLNLAGTRIQTHDHWFTRPACYHWPTPVGLVPGWIITVYVNAFSIECLQGSLVVILLREWRWPWLEKRIQWPGNNCVKSCKRMLSLMQAYKSPPFFVYWYWDHLTVQAMDMVYNDPYSSDRKSQGWCHYLISIFKWFQPLMWLIAYTSVVISVWPYGMPQRVSVWSILFWNNTLAIHYDITTLPHATAIEFSHVK